MKDKQEKLTPDGDIKITSKAIIKRGQLEFHKVETKTFKGIMEELETVHKRTKFYALFSGGKDSITVAHQLADMGKLEKVVHIKTGVGLQMTEDFVKDTCQDFGWPLQIIQPIQNFTYASHVLQHGFPGPGFHRVIMGKLKYQTMRNFALTADRKKHCLISGIRKFESARRMGNYPHPIQNEGQLWFCCPIFYYSDLDVKKYVGVNKLKISPAYQNGLGTSGECMCGAYATHGEKELIRKLDKKLADYIEWLEDGIDRFSTSAQAKTYSKWGGSAKMSELSQQQQLDEFIKDNPDYANLEGIEGLTCGVECGPGTMRGMNDY